MQSFWFTYAWFLSRIAGAKSNSVHEIKYLREDFFSFLLLLELSLSSRSELVAGSRLQDTWIARRVHQDSFLNTRSRSAKLGEFLRRNERHCIHELSEFRQCNRCNPWNSSANFYEDNLQSNAKLLLHGNLPSRLSRSHASLSSHAHRNTFIFPFNIHNRQFICKLHFIFLVFVTRRKLVSEETLRISGFS